MKHEATRTLLAHWVSLRRGHAVPDRTALDPAAIRSVLAYTFMLEVDGGRPAARRYPVCVSGTRLDALFGRSVKTVPFADLWLPQHGEELRMVVEDVLDEGRPAVLGGSAAPAGYEQIRLEMLVLPFRCQGRSHARLLCGLVPLAVPAWLGTGIQPLGLTTWRMIDAADETGLARIGRGAEAPTPMMRVPRRFTVIEGGRSTAEPSVQSRVKPGVPGSTNAPLSTQRS